MLSNKLHRENLATNSTRSFKAMPNSIVHRVDLDKNAKFLLHPLYICFTMEYSFGMKDHLVWFFLKLSESKF
jgi:hypothetical protein